VKHASDDIQHPQIHGDAPEEGRISVPSPEYDEYLRSDHPSMIDDVIPIPERTRDTEPAPPLPLASSIPALSPDGLLPGEPLHRVLEQMAATMDLLLAGQKALGAGQDRTEERLKSLECRTANRLLALEDKSTGVTRAARHWGEQVMELTGLVKTRPCIMPPGIPDERCPLSMVPGGGE
jgi:hypothetical protein